MSKTRNVELREKEKGAELRYYYECPRCESIATEWLGREKIGHFQAPIHYWVCQECCNVFTLMDKDKVRQYTGWVD